MSKDEKLRELVSKLRKGAMEYENSSEGATRETDKRWFDGGAFVREEDADLLETVLNDPSEAPAAPVLSEEREELCTCGRIIWGTQYCCWCGGKSPGEVMHHCGIYNASTAKFCSSCGEPNPSESPYLAQPAAPKEQP
jgi:hypothetical protein